MVVGSFNTNLVAGKVLSRQILSTYVVVWCFFVMIKPKAVEAYPS